MAKTVFESGLVLKPITITLTGHALVYENTNVPNWLSNNLSLHVEKKKTNTSPETIISLAVTEAPTASPKLSRALATKNTTKTPKTTRKGRGWTKKQKEAMAAAQKTRWAKVHAEEAAAAKKAAQKKKAKAAKKTVPAQEPQPSATESVI